MAFPTMTDHFGLANDDWELQSSSLTPEASSAQAKNEYGDVIAETQYEETESVECVYKLKSNGTLGSVSLPANFKGGYKATTHVITGGTLNTSNTDRPILTVKGEEFFPVADATALRVYDFATAIGEILAKKVATAIGFTLTGDTKLNASSVSASVDVSRVLDDEGAIVMVDTCNGRLEASGELVIATGTPAATAAASWTLMKGNDVNTENTGYGGGTVNVYQNLTAEA
ncbi:MAG: hypothetical protein WC373_01820 [Smithella sp.]|jgi:hypothetical protein